MNNIKMQSRLCLCLAAILAISPAVQATLTNYTWNVSSGNWSAPASWSPNTSVAGPTSTDAAIFGNSDATTSSSTVNNIVDASFAGAVFNLTYNSAATSGLYNVTQISSSQTLSVANKMLVGGLNEGAGGYTTYAYFTGPGTLVVTGTNLAVENYGTASGANATAYLNLSGLSTFVYQNPAGIVSVADTTLPETSGSLNTRAGGNLILAGTSNLIIANTINLGTCNNAQAGPTSTLVFGGGTNIIYAANFNIANNKNSVNVTFPNSTAGLKIRGVSGAGTDRANITVGNRNQTGTGTCSGSFVAVGNPLDIKAATLTIGANPNTGSTTGDTGIGTFQYDTGIVDASTIVIANTATANGTATGTLSVGASGTLIAGFGGISLATQTAGTATGNLNIAAGAFVTNLGVIGDGTAAGTGNLNLGGTLVMGVDATIGTASIPISSLSITNGAMVELYPVTNSSTVPTINVSQLNWPAQDSTLTIGISGLPSGTTVGSSIALLEFSSFNGTFTAPTLILPPGVTGNLSMSGNYIMLNITGGTIPPVPATPTQLSGTLQGGTAVQLNWTDSGATSYIVERATNIAGPYSFIAEGLTSASYTDPGVVTGVPDYYYEIIGVNAAGASAPSSPVAVALGPTLTSLSPSYVTLATNTAFTCTANSAAYTITNVQVIVTTTTLGGTNSSTITNQLGAAGLNVTGIGTSTASISYALTPNTVYSSVTIKVTDSNGITVTGLDRFDTLSPTLVIEASDFNFNGGQFIDTPPNGGLGLYVGQVGDGGVDENGATRTATKSYRPADSVVIQPAANQGTSIPLLEQKFESALASGDTDTNDTTEMEVGYNSPGQWENYSRTYGSSAGDSAPAGSYSIWLYSATSGSGVQEDLYQVTSDPTQPNQTTTFLGYFGTSSYANSSYNNYTYLPLVDRFGNVLSVTLSNVATLQPTVVGNPNLAFYMLMPPVPILSPTIPTNYPNGNQPYQETNLFVATLVSNQGTAVLTNTVRLVLNGINLSSDLTLTQTAGGWTVSCPLGWNQLYTGTLTATNANGLGVSLPLSFDTFSTNNLQVECVDYDFSTNNGTAWLGGLFIDNPVPTGDGLNITASTPQFPGTMATNSYFEYPTGFANNIDPNGFGAVAQQGIDVNFVSNNGVSPTNIGISGPGYLGTQLIQYRADYNSNSTQDYFYNAGSVSALVGNQPCTDYLRPKFLAAQTEFGDPNIGPWNVGWFYNGFWLNYTRHYPTNDFYVWARLATTGPTNFSGTTLSVVTSGHGTINQTTQTLGTFSTTNAIVTSNDQGWQWVELMNGGVPAIVPLNGLETLRLTSGGSINAELLMFAPAPPTLKSAIVNGQVNITFDTATGQTYQVWKATSLNPPNWTAVGSPISGNDQPAVYVDTTGVSGAASSYYYVTTQ